MSTQQHFVIVGVRETGEEAIGYRYCGGQDVVGPFDRSAAYEYAEKVQALFDSVPTEKFVYGEPFVLVAPARDLTAEEATSNWYLKEED